MLCVVEQARMIYPKSPFAVFFFYLCSTGFLRGSLLPRPLRTFNRETLSLQPDSPAPTSFPSGTRPVFPSLAVSRQNRCVNADSTF
jgi:hypothetical protein